MGTWKGFKKEIESFFAEGLKLQIHCSVYRVNAERGNMDMPRYWIALEKKIIWDYPKDFTQLAKEYPFENDMSAISDLIRNYIETPTAELLTKEFNDPWSLTELLIAADRRIGKRKLEQLKQRLTHPGALAILEKRWNTNPPNLV